MKRLIILTVLLMLTACGSSHQKTVLQNPYAERMKEISSNGVAAMQRERWALAERLFERALKAAQLANDSDLIGQAWYNLGTMHVLAGNDSKGEDAFKKAARLAEKHGFKLTHMRAKIALALLHQKQGVDGWQPETVGSSMPLDVHLSLARLAQLQKRFDISRREYNYVANKKSSDRASELYKIKAHMGLALIAEQVQEYKTAKQEAGKVLVMSRNIGGPRLAAHALVLSARLENDEAEKQEYLQRALIIYRALKDTQGEEEVLAQLKLLPGEQDDAAEVKPVLP